MAPRHATRNAIEIRRQPSVLKDQGKRPQGIRKSAQISPRRSARLVVSHDKNTEYGRSPASNSLIKQAPPQASSRKRKRSPEPEDLHTYGLAKRLEKRSQTSAVDTIARESADTENNINPIYYWVQEGSWPKEYFEQESDMAQQLSRKKSVSSLPGKQFDTDSGTPSAITPSDQKPREFKSTPYLSAQYQIVLETKGGFMRKSELGITDASKSFCQTLLEAEQVFPEDSLFQDDLFDETCDMIQARNEAKVIQDIARLIVPSAQSLATRGARSLKVLIESVNEGWNNSLPITQPRPQPDYSVGFKRTAFTEDQRKKLQCFIDFREKSYYMATYYMYLPFLTCEVKCGAAALDIADRQNAHSMVVAVRGVVELFRLVGREKELHREILAFSISHDDRSVRIYGHYPVINKKDATFYRHPIKTFDFTSEEGRDKWTAYKFTKNVYDIWMPAHFKRICSVIDELPPDINFDVSRLQSSEASGLSQVFDNQNLSQQSNPDTMSLAGNDDNVSSLAGSITPNTSLSHGTGQGVFKKPRKRRAVE
ncbi:MAG: hypothetical protein M1829_002985 [Trizodia sp. TS-e1964]|nr:MAG: hypothetical protein M1829_002985 [Trizodia sp. TS-e1964]